MAHGTAPRPALQPAEKATERLVDRLRQHALERPTAPAFSFLKQGVQVWSHYDFATLDLRARAIGAWLQSHQAQGERVALVMEPGVAYVSALLGCAYAGAVSVPLSFPSGPREQEQLQRKVKDAQPRFVFTQAGVALAVEDLCPGDQVVPVDAIDGALAPKWRAPALPRSDLAMLTYTLGKAGSPLAAQHTERSLATSLGQIQNAFALHPGDVILPWSTPCARMGLFGGILTAIYAGAHAVWGQSDSYQERPARFVQAAHTHHATHLLASHRAYAACASRTAKPDRDQLDLSACKAALVGPQPINPKALAAFSAAFENAGFAHQAFTPWYGVPEAGMVISGGDLDAAMTVVDLDADALEHHRVQLTKEGKPSRALVSVGRADPQQEVVVVDPRTGCKVPAGEIGELWIAGPQVGAGYRDHRALSQYTFRAFRSDTGEGPYLRTAELGFLLGGQLFVAGSLKDAITLEGHCFHPLELEHSAVIAHKHCGALAYAFTVNTDDEEQLVVVIEATTFDADPSALVTSVRLSISAHHALRILDVVVVPPGGANRGPSGPMQRRAMRRAYLASELVRLSERSLQDTTAALQEQLGCACDLLPGQLSPSSPLRSLGLDVAAASKLSLSLKQALGVNVPADLLLADVTLADVARQVALS